MTPVTFILGGTTAQESGLIWSNSHCKLNAGFKLHAKSQTDFPAALIWLREILQNMNMHVIPLTYQLCAWDQNWENNTQVKDGVFAKIAFLPTFVLF